MDKNRAIPDGFMKIGQLAKQAGISINTLRHYDKEGLLKPSGESEGGYRLYNDKDVAKLIQILMMKELGFGLADIKKRMNAFDTPADVVNVLTEHAKDIRTKMDSYLETIETITSLKEEISQMDYVDFKKYAGILFNLKIKNEQVWMLKHFDDDIYERFTKLHTKEKAIELIEYNNRLHLQASELCKASISPDSEEAQIFAKNFWGNVVETTGGDAELLQKMSEIEMTKKKPGVFGDDSSKTRAFLLATMEIYHAKTGGELDD